MVLDQINKLGETHPTEANAILKSRPDKRKGTAKSARKAIRKARLIEASLHKIQKIEEAIKDQANSFETNNRRIINAALERRHNCISIDHIIIENEIHTSENQVKALVDATMQQWTRKRQT